MKTYLLKIFKRYNEFLTLPLALLLYWFSAIPIRMVDPTAGVLDAGVLQFIVLGLVKVLFASGFAWLLLRWSFPKLYCYLDNYYELLHENPKSTLDESEKLCFNHALVLYLCYLAALLLAMSVLA